MDEQIKQFREILFWPLEIVDSGQCLDSEQLEQALVQDAWKRKYSLLLRGDDPCSGLTGQHYAEWVYFHPFAQRFLYPPAEEKRPPLRLFSRADIKKVRVWLGRKPPSNSKWIASISTCSTTVWPCWWSKSTPPFPCL